MYMRTYVSMYLYLCPSLLQQWPKTQNALRVEGVLLYEPVGYGGCYGLEQRGKLISDHS